jgi:hypothetical protein
VSAVDDAGPEAPPGPEAVPLYWRLLRLRHIRPNGWQRAVLVEGVVGTAVVLTLADVASAWTLLLLPLAAALLVKGHDVLAGALPGHRPPAALPRPRGADYLPWLAVLVVAVVAVVAR